MGSIFMTDERRHRIKTLIRGGMKHAGLNQVELAQRVGVSKHAVKMWLYTRVIPEPDTADLVDDVLGLGGELVAEYEAELDEADRAAVQLRATRLLLGLDQAEASRRLGVGVTTLRNWEAGRNRMSLSLPDAVERMMQGEHVNSL